jgi:cell wall-active antibiotic response 4TMS protein YvqF
LSSSPAYGPPAASPRRRRGGVVGPLILIFIGGVFLLQNTGYLPPNFWLNLWRLWPVVLVLAGIELLLANRIPRFALTGLAAVILVGGAVATNSGLGAPQTSAVVSRADQKELGGARQAAVTVRFDAGQLVIGPIERPSAEQLSTMAYTGPADQAPQARYAVSGDTGRLDYAASERSGPSFTPFVGGGQSNSPRMELNLSPLVPITSLSLKAGATDARLDLSSLRVSDIDMSVGAAATWIRVPEAAGRTTARISGGASSITLEVPQGVAAQIRVRGGLSSVKVDESRFPQVSDHFYRSANYETAQNQIDLNFETGVTSIQVS